jgi:ribosomal protein S1
MKQLEKNPWEGLAERYPSGTVLRGTVRNITNFGVFVEVEPGIDGLVHISDLSWTKKIRHPGEVVKKGQELDVVVLEAAMETCKSAADVKEQLGDGVAPEHFVDGTATREHLQLAQESYAEAIGGE